MNNEYVIFRESKNSYYIRAKSNNLVILSLNNFYGHIKRRHPEMTIGIILDILVNPDMVYKPSRNSKDKYYEKVIMGHPYRVVVTRNKPKERIVSTAYLVEFPKEFIYKHTYCVYDKNDEYYALTPRSYS